MPEEPTPAEIREITGRTRPASQAAELAKRGIAFWFTGQGVKVPRAVALAYDLLPQRGASGVDLKRVR